MKLNPAALLVGRNQKPTPVLLAVTPPRTGEHTLLGVENLLQSIAVPEPFSLGIAADADSVTLMARCHDRAVVRQQLSIHYPQARVREVPEEDPLGLAPGEQAWSTTLLRQSHMQAAAHHPKVVASGTGTFLRRIAASSFVQLTFHSYGG